MVSCKQHTHSNAGTYVLPTPRSGSRSAGRSAAYLRRVASLSVTTPKPPTKRWLSSSRIATAKSGSLKRARPPRRARRQARRREAEGGAVGEVVDALEDAEVQLRRQLAQPVRGRGVVLGACAGRAMKRLGAHEGLDNC